MIKKILTILSYKEKESISAKVGKGVVWSFLTTIIMRGLDLFSAIIVTRLLLPEDFGLLAASMAVIVFSTKTTQTGFASALIQKQQNPESYFNTAWTFEVIKGFLLFQLLFWGAPLISIILQDERLTPILKSLSFLFIFVGMRNIGVVNFRKHLNFQKQSLFELIPLILKTFIVIVLAIVLKSVWAMVFTQLLVSITTLVLSYLLHPYRPKFHFDLTKTRELFNFGKWILLSSFVNMVREQGITMFIIRLFDAAILGYYDRAAAFAKKSYLSFVQLLWKVCYPAFSKISHDLIKMRIVYLLSLRLIAYLGFPIVVGVIMFGKDFTILVLTEKWINIVPLLYIFSLNGLVGFIQAPAGISFQAMGKPQIGTTISMYGILILLILVFPFSSLYGIRGTALALLISNSIILPLSIYRLSILIEFSFFEFLRQIFYPIITTLLMVLVLIFIKTTIFPLNSIMDLVVYFVISILIYGLITYLIDKLFNLKVFNLIGSIMRGNVRIDEYVL